MTCPDCTESARQPWHGFRFGCKGCAARVVARGQNFARCRNVGKQDRQYQDELRLLDVTHDEVRAAFSADMLGK